MALVVTLVILFATVVPAHAMWRRPPGARPVRAAGILADPGPSTPADANDPGDSTPVGPSVTDVSALPFVVTRNLAFDESAADWDRDFFRMSMVAGHTYRVTATPVEAGWGESDPMIDVGESVDVTGTDPLQWYSLVELGNARSDTRASDVYVTARQSGTHYVWVGEDMFSFMSGGGGSYELRIADLGLLPAGSVRRIDGMTEYGSTPVYAESDRYSVAASLAETLADGTQPKTIILASGLDRAAADAMTAGSLSGVYDAPILLVRGGYYAGKYYDASPAWSTRLPAATAKYLQRLKAAPGASPIDFMIAGGPASVPDSIKAVVLANAPAGSRFVARFTGADRYAVAAAIAARVRSVTATSAAVFVTSAQVSTYFYDTLAVSSLAAHSKVPILLTKATVVPPSTLVESRRFGKKIVIGDDRAIQAPVLAALGMTRDPWTGAVTGGDWIGYFEADWGGYDRDYMARLISEYGEDKAMTSGTTIGLANKLMDALAGGAAVGRLGGSMVYTDADMMDLELTEGWIIGHRGDSAPHVVVVGGTATIEPQVVERSEFLVGMPPSP